MRSIRWLAVVPFLALIVGPFFVNRATPLILGLPFLLAWIVAWILLTSAHHGRDLRGRSGQPGGRAMNGALPFIAAAALLALALGFLASRGKDMNLEQWTVGGRGFGALFVFLLLAGEIYTTFTFLGGSGFAYGKGAPAYYILCYGTLAYVLSYFMLPPIWRYAKENRLYSQSDFFVRKYDSPSLGVLVALVDIVALIPYLVLQFKGLGIIVEIAGYGAISSTVAIWIGAVVVAAYVMVSGVHGSAWTSVAKDTLILGIVVFLGIYLPVSLLRRAGADVRGDRTRPSRASPCCRRTARACGGSPRPCCSPRSASTCGRTRSPRSTPPKAPR